MTFRFVSNVDGTDSPRPVKDLAPAKTLHHLFENVHALETMPNAHTLEMVMKGLGGDEKRSQAFCCGVRETRLSDDESGEVRPFDTRQHW